MIIPRNLTLYLSLNLYISVPPFFWCEKSLQKALSETHPPLPLTLQNNRIITLYISLPDSDETFDTLQLFINHRNSSKVLLVPKDFLCSWQIPRKKKDFLH